MPATETLNPPGKPGAVEVSSISSTAVRVEWTAPTAEQSEKIGTMRRRIEQHFLDLKLNPMAMLAKFDNRPLVFAEKRRAYLEIMSFVVAEKRKMIVEGLNLQPWDLSEIDRYLAKFRLDGGLNAANEKQILEIWTDMREGKML